VGRRFSGILRSQDIFLAKVTEEGSVPWILYFNGKGTSTATSVTYGSEEQAAFTGYRNDKTFVYSVTSTGIIQWGADYYVNTYANSIISVDSDYVIAGADTGSDRFSEFFIAKISHYGAALWWYAYGTTNDAAATQVIQTKNGGFAATGYIKEPASVFEHIGLALFDKDGKIGTFCYVSTSVFSQIGKSIIQYDDNSFVIASLGAGLLFWLSKPELVRIDDKGVVLETKEFNYWNGGIYESASLIKTRDGGFALAGYWRNWIWTNAFLMKLDNKLDYQWKGYFSLTTHDKGVSVVEERDGRLTVLSYAYTYVGFVSSAWIYSAYCGGGTYLHGNDCELCSHGEYNPAGFGFNSRCIKCPKGTFSDDGAAACTPCPEGTFSNREGSGSCQKCPPGMQAPSKGSLKCIPCAIGSYADQPGTGHCPVCPKGTFNTKEGQTKCNDCDVGQYTPQPGATQCTDCPIGTFNNIKGAPDCTPCSPGWYQDMTKSTDCKICGKGTFSYRGSSSCTDCPEGEYSPVDGSPRCTKCEEGRFNNKKKQSSCEPCGKGKHSDHQGAIQCDPCDPGFFNNQFGQKDCSPCGKDTYNPKYGSIEESECLKCQLPKHSYFGFKECINCIQGRHFNVTHSYFFDLSAPIQPKCYIDSCLIGYMETPQNLCLECDKSCATCSAPHNVAACTECYSGKRVENGRCVDIVYEEKSTWWIWLISVLGVLIIIAGVLFFLYKKGIIFKNLGRNEGENLIPEEKINASQLEQPFPNKNLEQQQPELTIQEVPPQNMPVNDGNENKGNSEITEHGVSVRRPCNVCFAKPTSMVLVPCGHRFCEDCPPKFKGVCPDCRVEFTSAVKYY